MAIGLFLDVDNTLTKDYIQRYYARALGCVEQYDEIEKAFGVGDINADQFGDQLIATFASQDFTEEKADSMYASVVVQDWVDVLFTLPVDHYLVSSGPSYFIRRFALEHAIPDRRVLCSQYFFRGEGDRISSCQAVNDQMKASFVGRQAGRYELTIGVGDDVDKDGPFLSACTLPILVGAGQRDSSYLGARSFNSLFSVLERVTSTAALNRGTWAPGGKPRCFIGSSGEDRKVARAFATAGTADFCTPALWEFSFPPGRTAIEALEGELERSDFAVLVIEPTDTVASRGVEWGAPRDNVVFELGLFMGALGRGRVFLLCPTNVSVKIPSDLSGVTRLSYEPPATSDGIHDALVGAVESLRQAVEES